MSSNNAASLGELAVHQGLIGAEERQVLSGELRQAVREGSPLSMARLLIRHGHPPDIVSTVLASGLVLSGVCCDACGAATPQSSLQERREYPCGRCGSFLLGFASFAPDLSASRVGAETDRYPRILPLPEAAPRPVRTQRYEKIHDLPEDPADSTNPYGHVLPIPIQPPAPEGETSEGEASRRFEEMLAHPTPTPSSWAAIKTELAEESEELDWESEGRTLSPGELEEIKRGISSEGPSLGSEALTLGPGDLVAPTPQVRAVTPRRAATQSGSAPPPKLLPLVLVLLLLLGAVAAGIAALLLGG